MHFTEIGWVETCYGEKFGVPRQSRIVSSAWGKVRFHTDFQSEDFVRGLDGFSHLWLVFVFHQSVQSEAVKATVRPPRLGGNEKVGVFASRSPFRPNPIGLSLVKLEKIELSEETGAVLHVSGVDAVSETPLVDIKPYIPFCDSVNDGELVRSGYVQNVPVSLSLDWACYVNVGVRLQKLIEETVAADPRPAYHDDEREYGCIIENVNVRWIVEKRFEKGGSIEQKVVKILSCTKVL